MTDADTLSLLVFVLCLGGSMFFSGSETAITSYGDRRARRAKEEGGREGKLLAWWVDRPVMVLSTILLGNNITNTLMGATATALAIRHLEGTARASWAVPLAVVITTGFLLLFGEIVPKALGKLYSRRVTLPVLTVLNALAWLSYPLVWSLSKVTRLIIRRVSDSDEDSGHRVTSGEIGYLVKVAEREGTIPAEQAELLQQVFRFEEKIVRDIMVPLDRVVGVDLDWEVEKIKRVAHATGHSRLPVYAGNLDNVRGILHIKQIVGLDDAPPSSESSNFERIEKLLRPPFFVSESLLIHDLLRRFKEQRVHLAIVVDDAGDTVGVVTLEDVIEQLVGQIFDESDRAPLFAPLDSGVKYLDGQASLHTAEEALNVDFEDIDGVDSVGDLLTRLAGQMPIAGSVFVWEGVRFKILAADATRIIRVSAERVEIEDDDKEN
ncbi:Magnesium and cobalt efflux protein CorC [Enhygromyxa salina]|uniref:Magnesium and cobalt efflux protein CorC n=1 Tax=Enhygromyxa salina TaxID=215803 RepID=A0A2S9YF90_9BACT|nr:hemolysin family protein [Enhygromyxa salina]PRQ03702.1 Magnesium and cobalt efflux protein CorC [Enhygromyxa salina]